MERRFGANRIRRWLAALAVAALAVVTAGCGDEPSNPDIRTDYALVMYFPWSGNLTSYFQRNISDMEAAVAEAGLTDERVVVYFAESATEAELFELVPDGDGSVRRVSLKSYAVPPAATADGVAALFSDIRELVPSERYRLTVGSHGMGWLPVKRSAEAEKQRSRMKRAGGGLPTRFFGGLTAEYQIDVTDFAAGVERAGLHFDFILFDDCYMSSVEAVYDLREVCDYVVASPCEMMADGLPYSRIGRHLLGETDLEAVCDGFYDYYTSTSYPYATLAVTSCAELDAMASVMRRINGECASLSKEMSATVQAVDCYSPAVFQDMEDYVAVLCAERPDLLAEYRGQLARTVVKEVHTPYYYTSSAGRKQLLTCCGLSVSDGSFNTLASGKSATAWWAATHQ